jgi:hypothetical protein
MMKKHLQVSIKLSAAVTTPWQPEYRSSSDNCGFIGTSVRVSEGWND